MKTHFSQLFLYLLEQFHRALQSLHSLYVLTWSISEINGRFWITALKDKGNIS